MTKLADIPKPVVNTVVAASPVTSTAFTIANAISGSFSLNMMMCLIATESLANMQFLNINHSNIASTVYSAMSSSYIPNWIASFNDLDPELLIFPWGIFQENQISSLFLDNFGDALTETLAHLGAFLLIACATFSMRIEKLNSSSMGKLYVITFSFFASNLFGQFQSLLLNSVLQLLKVNLFLDSYSIISYLTGYLTLSLTIGLLVFFFFKVLSIFNNRINRKKNTLRILSNESSRRIRNETKWLEKKYEFLFDDFKQSHKNQFFFVFWMAAFNAFYIFLIIFLQNAPIVQCFLVVVLVLVFILFPAAIKPFENKTIAYLYFFNFACILLVAILNLALAITQYLNPAFSGVEAQGKAVVSIIAINAGTNAIISLGELLIVIYQKLKNYGKEVKKRKEKKSNMGLFRSATGKTHKNLSQERKSGFPRDSRSIREKKIINKTSASNPLTKDSFKLKIREVVLPKTKAYATRRRILRAPSISAKS